MCSQPRMIHVEFFGIPRIRAGVAQASLRVPQDEIHLSKLLTLLADEFPALSAECFANGLIRQGFTASLNGQRFISQPEERIRAGETVLLFSADAGG